jgi:RHS repeat-associated protein
VAPINRSPFHADQPAARSCLLPTNNQEQSVGSCIPTYDASGDLTKDCSFANPHTYIWNAYNLPGTLYTENVTYDALNREVEFEVDSSYSQILYSPIGKLGVMQGQTPVRTRFPLPGGSTAEITGANGGYYILHADWLGTSRLATSFSSRAMAEDVAYAPFGEYYAVAGNIESPLNFTGQSQDTLSGLYDFLYREYSPVQGRWISPDPTGLNAVDITNPQSWNRYAYVYNNPLSNIDPWGLACYPIYFQLAGGCSPELTEGVSFGQSWNPFTTVVIAPASGAIFDGPICWNCTYVYYAFVSAQSGDTAANNGPSSPLVMKNPCSVQGRALPPGAYVTQGQQANASTTNFLLDVSMGWPKGDYLDPQPLASGNVFQNQAYGNYVFGVYMASAGSSLNTALSGASALALGSGAYFTYTKNGYQMDPNYPLLPAANVGNITNGYNAQRNGTVCHN